MNKIKTIGTGLAISAGMLLSAVGLTFAAPPVADPTVVASTTDAITGLQQAGTANLATLIPIAAVLLISVAVVFFVVRHFRAMAHV